MALKLYCILILTAAVAIDTHVTVGNEAKNKNTYGELPCLAIGGLCVLTSDCPEGKQTPVKGLCPLQQKSGVECCYSLPISETRCRMKGGECVRKQIQCPDNLTFLRATDCGQDEKCCILVN